jgi:hypothetical protein
MNLPGYDAWKTTDPNDGKGDELDIEREDEVHCFECGDPIDGEIIDHQCEPHCQGCYDLICERAWEHAQEDGEAFRGGEAAAFEAEQQAWIQRNLK